MLATTTASTRTVVSVMTAAPVTVASHTPFQEIVAVLARWRISAVPVTGPDGSLLGVVSEGELLDRPRYRPSGPRHRVAAELTAAELMTGPVCTIDPDLPVAAAAELLAEHGVRRLYVVRNGKLVGVLAQRDVLGVYRRPDAEIRAQLEQELTDGLADADPRLLRVSVRAGEVLLTGRVPWHRDVAAVRRRAAEVPGVVDVRARLDFVWDDRR